MVDYDEQMNYWESISGRRVPDHPAVRAFADPKIALILKRVDGFAGNQRSLLEIGAGNGFFSTELNKHFDLRCTDFSPNMLKINPIPEAQKQVCDAENIPFEDGAFDMVFCANLLHHLEDPEIAVREMARVAREYVCLVEPNILNPAMFLFGLLKKEEHGSLKFTHRYMQKLLSGAGLKTVLLKQQGLVVPNKTPPGMVRFLSSMDIPFPLGLYHVAVCKV